MKLTNKDLRKIILEEIEAVLSEDEHPAIANSDEGFVEDEKDDAAPPKPIAANDLKSKLVDASRAMNDPKVVQKMKGRDSGYLGAAIEDAFATALGDGDNTAQAREDAIKRQQTKKRFKNK